MKTFQTLEFDTIKNQLCTFALSANAREKAATLSPFLDERQCKKHMQETTEAKQIIEWAGTPPLAAMDGLSELLELAHIGAMLSAEQLLSVSVFLAACKRMKGYLKKAEIRDINIATYSSSFYDLEELNEEICHSIRNNRVDDSASTALRDIRRKIEQAHNAIKSKLEGILRGRKEWFEDGYIATRNGRQVLPVKSKYKNQISGSVIDTSGTGNTYFIEPTSVRKLQEDLSSLQIDEDNEIRKILYTLTASVSENDAFLKINIECMETLDFLFAKAKLSLEMNARFVPITTNREIIIHKGRHPLLSKENVIPLDFAIGDKHNGIIITGPNTGGKTVALKTVGLLSLMAQCGLHVPVDDGSVFCMHSQIVCDIGDGQSISENLSTFSSHITNIIEILNTIDDESLVLLDELGSGTDPAEGMGIAIAILEELRKRGCLFLASTHYPEVKAYAEKTSGLLNARMAFDRESLKPLYRLELGEAGESCALYIARRLGFPEHLLKRAYEEAYSDKPQESTATPAMDFAEESEQSSLFKESLIKKEFVKKAIIHEFDSFQTGDSVMVYPQKEIGIIYKPSNEKGQLTIQIKGEKLSISHKRIKLITPASELYPPDYDFSILFDTIENRKARHRMEKGHRPDLKIEY